MRITLAAVIAFAAISLSLLAQDVTPPPVSAIESKPVAPASTVATPLPSVASVMAQRQAAAQDTELDEPTRALLDQHFAKVLENLQAAEQADRRIATLSKELEGAPQRVTELQEQLGTPLKPEVTPAGADEVQGLDALTARLKESEIAAASARQRLQESTTEIERRAARRPQLADLKVQAEQQLQEVGQMLSAPAPEGEPPQVGVVRTLRLQSRQHRLRREIALLEQEARTYEGANRLWTLQRDLADRELRELDRIVQYWQQQTAEARRFQAEAEALAARRASALSHPSIRTEAEKNSELADVKTAMVESLHQTQLQLDRTTVELKERTQAFESLKKRAEAAEFSPAIGVLLRNQRSDLPDRDDLYYRIQARQTEVSSLNLKLVEWEAERKPLIDLTTATARIIKRLDSVPMSISIRDLEEQVQVILAARLKLLGDLIENGSSQLDQLVQLDSQEKLLLTEVDEESRWLAEHVLWVRSTGFLGTPPNRFFASVTTFLEQLSLGSLRRVVLQDMLNYRWWWGASSFGWILLLIGRSWARRRIKILGEAASRSNCTEFLPTIKTLFLTLLVASPLPSLVWCLGMRLFTISRGENTLQALGIALQVAAACWLLIELVRHVAQPHGIGDAHFDWPETSMAIVRRTMRWLTVSLLPALLVVAYTEFLSDEEISSSVGRLAYLVAMACAGWAVFRLIHPSSPIMQTLENEHSEELLWRTHWIWTGLLFASPIVLSVLSLIGFHYTAVQLTGRVAATIGSALGALFITAILSRWLLVKYRKLAIRRGRERRQQMLQAAQADPDQPIPQDTTPELRLVDINVQARRLLRLTATVGTLVALYLIWIDVLPALGILRKIELWPNSLVTRVDDAPIVWVTAGDILVAVFIGGLTLVASRNVPGLMEIVILQRLPLDAGARYAASNVTRYLIVVTGFLLGFRAIGIGWSSVQWLVAAMTVGLGFGLQEIFANFVSGIILLFERPIRVGDTVTIGEITGTVTRIQIRATTILDWDNKELIVPNREFVTGNLVNWTLSSPTLRVIIKVGVAYGSDTRLATRLLYRVAEENPQVLDDPEPVVVFTEFGDSSLNFELRLYVNGLMNYRRLKHELNLAIDDLFREHKIEIAFPQRDLHVRSLPEGLLEPRASASETTVSREGIPVDQVAAASLRNRLTARSRPSI